MSTKDVDEAIIDIQEAIEEYGTSISVKKLTTSEYDIDLGEEVTTEVSYSTKALVNQNSTVRDLFSVLKSIESYDLIFSLYFDGPITKEDKIEYDGATLEILYIESKVLQGKTFLYQLVCKV